jgi:hypothetical protein
MGYLFHFESSSLAAALAALAGTVSNGLIDLFYLHLITSKGFIDF